MAATEPEFRPINITFPTKANDSEADLALVARHAMSYAGPFRAEVDVDTLTGAGAGHADGGNGSGNGDKRDVHLSANGRKSREKTLAGQVFHGPLTVGSAPGLLGTTFTRRFEVHDCGEEGVELLLVASNSNGGRAEIWWRRVGKD